MPVTLPSPLAVSVVIPAHNRAHSLPACLDSVLDQTLPPAEVLVVDDRSSDDTAAVLARYADRGVRHLCLDRGQGAQAARNRGWREARHPWIAFQDSDDLWLPDKLARQAAAVQAAGGGPDLVVHGDGWRRDESTGHRTPVRPPTTDGPAAACHARLLLQPGPLFPTLLTTRVALERAGGLDDDCPSYQEWDTALRLSRHCRFVHLHVPLFVWVWHPRETISKDAARAVRGYCHVTDRHRADILATHGARAWRRLRLDAVALALRGGLWPQALAIIDNEAPHPSLALARALAQARLAPRGTGRLLRLLA
jgi:glycosyltransferase involved in cell wall biosynthesis